jgi:hypothetical protein
MRKRYLYLHLIQKKKKKKKGIFIYVIFIGIRGFKNQRNNLDLEIHKNQIINFNAVFKSKNVLKDTRSLIKFVQIVIVYLMI